MAQRKKTTKAKPAAKRPSRKLKDLEPRDADKVRGGTDWTVLKPYRVWDANRQVFVYPENWLQS
jgi:hypothetical protein